MWLHHSVMVRFCAVAPNVPYLLVFISWCNPIPLTNLLLNNKKYSNIEGIFLPWLGYKRLSLSCHQTLLLALMNQVAVLEKSTWQGIKGYAGQQPVRNQGLQSNDPQQQPLHKFPLKGILPPLHLQIRPQPWLKPWFLPCAGPCSTGANQALVKFLTQRNRK